MKTLDDAYFGGSALCLINFISNFAVIMSEIHPTDRESIKARLFS